MGRRRGWWRGVGVVAARSKKKSFDSPSPSQRLCTVTTQTMTTTLTLALLAALASLLPLCAVRAMNASSGALFFAGNATPAQEGGAIPIPLPGVLASVAVELPIHWNRIGVHLNETKSAQYWHQDLRDAPEATIRGRLRGERKGQRKERTEEGKER